uniref:DUF2637 domain-containing protein n=1 Tax=Streptomyces sp. SM11 TaxID=565557 RepID=UPI002156122A
MQLTRTHRILIGVVIAGAVLIAAIGFAGSYAAVRELAEEKGFGRFSLVFPIGIDAGICVLLALDLLLTWMRIPFPLLRQTAWLLTAATIAFNGAASWPDPLGTAMHAVIPVLFVVSVEAARHAVGRIADITADKHMEGVRLTRWLLSPVPTFKLWRRMKLWELRSYEQVIKLEQDRLIYQARLQARFGRSWRRKAPVESMMPLRLAKYGVPLAETAPAGLAAAGIESALLPPAEGADTEEETPVPTSGHQRRGERPAGGESAGARDPAPAVEDVAQAAVPASPDPVPPAKGYEGDHIEQLTGGSGWTSAWFGTDQKAPAGGATQGEWEVLEPWSGAPGETPDDNGRSSHGEVRVGASVPGGASAGRAGERHGTVHLRAPERDGEQASSPTAREKEKPAQERPEQEPAILTGPRLVASRYWELSAEERSSSANSLAPLLAEGTGYTVGTVRKYLGDIKRAEKQAAATG